MWKNLFSDKVNFLISQYFRENEVCEIRLRRDKPLMVKSFGNFCEIIDVERRCPYICTSQDIERVIITASKNSVYAVSEQISKGFICFDGGIRIGICGEGVINNKEITAIKNISSLTIRVPHQIFGLTERLGTEWLNFENTLIISPPAAGKTTLLREMCRVLSNCSYNIALIDERGEISGSSNGQTYLDVGKCTDVICYTEKNAVYENIIRSMSPDIIVTDEIYGEREMDNLYEANRCGIKICATIHAGGMEDLERKTYYSKIINCFKKFIVLSKVPCVGTISKIFKCEGVC